MSDRDPQALTDQIAAVIKPWTICDDGGRFDHGSKQAAQALVSAGLVSPRPAATIDTAAQVEHDWIEWAQDVSGAFVTTRDDARAAIGAIPEEYLRFSLWALPQINSEPTNTAAQALRDAAEAARGMHDPIAPDCAEWADWLNARADRLDPGTRTAHHDGSNR